jgi:hypothetical protein
MLPPENRQAVDFHEGCRCINALSRIPRRYGRQWNPHPSLVALPSVV